MISYIVSCLLALVISIIIQVDVIYFRLVFRRTIGSCQAVMCQVVIHVAITQEVIVFLETQCERSLFITCCRNTFPVEVVVIRFVDITVWYRIKRMSQRVCWCQLRTGIYIRIIRQSHVNTIDYKLEIGLYRVETCQISRLFFYAPCFSFRVGYRFCIPHLIVRITRVCIEHLYFIRVTHEVPLQMFRYGVHTVFRRAELQVVIWLCGIINERVRATSTCLLLLRLPCSQILIYLFREIVCLDTSFSLMVEESMMDISALSREVHEIHMVIIGIHCFHFGLCRSLFKEYIRCHFITCIYTLSTISGCTV